MSNFSEIIEWFMNPEVSRIFVIALLVYVIILWVSLIVWVTKDIISRTNNIVLQIISILVVVILNIFGILIYLAIRPSKTLIEKFFEDLEYEALVEESKREKEKPHIKKKRRKGRPLKKK